MPRRRKRKYPIDRREALEIWSRLRKVIRIDWSEIARAKKPKQALKKKLKLSKSKQVKRISKLIDRSNFFEALGSHYRVKARVGGKVISRSYSRFTPTEKGFIRARRGMKTVDLVRAFNRRFPTRSRTYSSIAVAKNRLKSRRRKR